MRLGGRTVKLSLGASHAPREGMWLADTTRYRRRPTSAGNPAWGVVVPAKNQKSNWAPIFTYRACSTLVGRSHFDAALVGSGTMNVWL